jgi:Zn-dependent peptidase ImmA (M78 family)
LDVIKPYRYLAKDKIENIATNLRLQVEKKRSRPLRADSVAEAIADELDLGVVWEYIPADETGNIAAMIFPTQKEIIINANIPALKGGFGQSTIAHEIGHWILHINQETLEKYSNKFDKNIKTEIKPFLCRSVQSLNGVEWQAQYFASCLLMPEYKLIESIRGRDLTNWKHLYAIANELGVTISNLTTRLKSINWIILHSSSKQIYFGKNAPNKISS